MAKRQNRKYCKECQNRNVEIYPMIWTCKLRPEQTKTGNYFMDCEFYKKIV